MQCPQTGLNTAWLLQVKCVKRPLSGHEHILAAAHRVGLRSVLDRADVGVPERHRGLRPPQAKSNQIPGPAVGEEQTAVGTKPAAPPNPPADPSKRYLQATAPVW